MFEWKEIPQRLELNKKQKLCLDLGEESGLNNGLGILMRGPNQQVAGIALATSEKKDAFDGNIDLISAYCQHFYIHFKRLKSSNQNQYKNVFLTNKERDVLTLVLYGQSDSAIADKLHMSSHTVDSHMRKIFRKLEANNRIVAVTKALMLGLIQQ